MSLSKGTYSKLEKKEFRINLRVSKEFLEDIEFILEWDKQFRGNHAAKNLAQAIDYAVHKMKREMKRKLEL